MTALQLLRLILGVASLILGVLAMRGARWAYVTFIALSLLYFPIRAEFDFKPRACNLDVSGPLAASALQNYGHVVLFAVFFVMSYAQFHGPGRGWWALLATVVMGALVEISQGITGAGNCRLRDLLPDVAGALLAWTIVLTAMSLWRHRPPASTA